MKWFAVFAGGGLGSLLRFALSYLTVPFAGLFPWATLVANALAAALLAWLFTSNVKQENELVWQLMAVGFCGGLSTFSTFSMETVQLMRSGQTAVAWAYMVFSVALSLILFYFIAQWFQRV
jgi:CrcB protein